jgi:hypothetical protein
VFVDRAQPGTHRVHRHVGGAGQVYHDVQKLVGADTERGAAIPPSTAWLGHASSETEKRGGPLWRPNISRVRLI